jgi:hypothetical protein
MILMTCPWCEDVQLVEFAQFTVEFRCDSCGTTAELADESVPADLAEAA